MKQFLFITTIFLLLCFSVSVNAEVPPSQVSRGDSSDCIELIRDCLMFNGLEKNNCLFTASTHPHCEKSPVGKITYKRWVLSPIPFKDKEVPSSLLGPTSVSKTCIDKFDNDWAELLRNGKVQDDDIKRFDRLIESCKLPADITLPKP